MRHTIQGLSSKGLAQEEHPLVSDMEWVEGASQTSETSIWEPATDNQKAMEDAEQ